MSHPELSDAEDLALRTLWRRQGFVDSDSREFVQRARLYRWRSAAAVLIALPVIALCIMAPEWLLAHLPIHVEAQDWFTQYLTGRGLMASAWVLIAAYCWSRQRHLLSFWVALTTCMALMWGLDRWVVSLADAPQAELESPLLWPLRLSLLAIGLINIWRHAYAPLREQRGLRLAPASHAR